MKRVVWILAVALVGLSPAAWARTWRVEKDGSGDYTIIQDALDAAASGDTIRIGPGRFADFREYQTNGGLQSVIAMIQVPTLTLIGAGADVTIIGPEQYTWDGAEPIPRGSLYIAQPPEGTVNLLALTHENLYSGVYAENAGALAIVGCVFRSGRYGVDSADPTTVVDSRFESCITGIWIKSPAGIGTVVDCTFDYKTSGRCVNFDYVGIGTVIDSSFLADSAYSTAGVMFYGSGGGVNNCEFSGLRQPIYMMSALHPTLERNVVQTPGVCIQSNTEDFTATENILRATGPYPVVRMYTRGRSHVITGNHIVHGTGLAVEILAHTGPDDYHLDMTNNWWGTTNPDSIAAWIHDGNDVRYPPMECTVDFEPFASGPVPNEAESFGGLKAMFR